MAPPSIRDLTREECDALLHSQVVARLGCHADGETYVVPVTYAMLDGAVVGHTTPGRKVRMLRHNPHVCVEVDRVDGLADWASVIAWGRYQELDETDAASVMSALVARVQRGGELSPHAAQPHPSAVDASQTVVYRILLDRVTGRTEEPASDGHLLRPSSS